jgi:GT2 family glycosyltransferase
MPKLFVIIATVGRPELTAKTVNRLADQTRPPDGVIVVSVRPEDVVGVDQVRGNVQVQFSAKGSAHQRNHGLAQVIDTADTIVFFDDDFIPAADYLAEVERHFAEHPDVVGVTGNLIADGINTGGIALEDAAAMVARHQRPKTPDERPRQALYGCNMAIRASAARDLRFDENLPLYAWLEDIDYSTQLARRGRLISSDAVTGVHMGVKGGRTSGIKFGYSQVANVVYLKRKGTMQPGLGGRLMRKQLLSNLLRSIRPEPHIDRRGRLIGNLMALGDVLRGRVDPGRINRL